jgi:hypothetical protein
MASSGRNLLDLPWQLTEKTMSGDLHQSLFERTLNKGRRAAIDQELKHYYKLVTGEESTDMQRVITFLKQVNLLHTVIYGWKDIPMPAKIKELKSYDRNSPTVKKMLYLLMKYTVESIEDVMLNEDENAEVTDLVTRFRNINRDDSLDNIANLAAEILNFASIMFSVEALLDYVELEFGHDSHAIIVNTNRKSGLLLPILSSYHYDLPYGGPGPNNPLSVLFNETVLAFSIVGNVLLHLPNMFVNTPSNIQKYNILKRESRVNIYNIELYHRYFRLPRRDKGVLDNDLVYNRAIRFLKSTPSALENQQSIQQFETVIGQPIPDLFYRLYIEKQKNLKNIPYWDGVNWVRDVTFDSWSSQYKSDLEEKLKHLLLEALEIDDENVEILVKHVADGLRKPHPTALKVKQLLLEQLEIDDENVEILAKHVVDGLPEWTT